MKKSYGNVYFDSYKNIVHLWEFVDGNRFYKKINHQIEYYVKDATGKSTIKDPFGVPVTLQTAQSIYKLKEEREYGNGLFESDIDQETKYLHKAYEKDPVLPNIQDYQVASLDIEIAVQDEFPEAYEAKFPINLITVHMSKFDEFYTFGTQDYYGKTPCKYIKCDDEKDLLERFCRFFARCKVDIITGWNVGFDIDTIINRIIRNGLSCSLSPLKFHKKSLETWRKEKDMEIHGRDENYVGENWGIPGVAVLDYMQFFKDPKFMQKRFDSYSLQNIGMEVVGRGKMEFEGSLNEFYKKEWDKFVDYNIEDVKLVLDIDKKMKFLELALNLSHNSLIPIEKVFSAVAVTEGQLLIYFHERNMVMNDRPKKRTNFKIDGGFTKAYPGYYENGISIDAESLYPRMIISWGVSPENLVMNPAPEMIPSLQRTPLSETHGIYFKKTPGFLCDITAKNFEERKKLKDLKLLHESKGELELAKYYDTQQNIRKTFLNSIYGCCCNDGFHYFNPNLAISITLGGQNIIKHMEKEIIRHFDDTYFQSLGIPSEKNPKRIILMDTDSVFINFDDVRKKVYSHLKSPEWGFEFMEKVLKPVIDQISRDYFASFGSTGQVNFKIEKIINQVVVFAKKNYACKVAANEGVVYNPPKTTITGFASKKSDRPKLCRKMLGEIIEKFFDDPTKEAVLDNLKTCKVVFDSKGFDSVAKPQGITDLQKYSGLVDYEANGMIHFGKGVPFHIKSAYSYNHLIKLLKVNRVPASEQTGVKSVWVKPNIFGVDAVGFVGSCPKEISDNFEVDYERQFEVNMINPIQKLFDVMDWGEVNLSFTSLDNFLV